MKAIYKVADIVRLGLYSLTVHKVRSLLTALGIIFGVWSVIAMLAISQGASYESQLALRRLGSDNIIISSVKPPDDAAGSRNWGALTYGLTDEDVACLKDNVPGVRRCVTSHTTGKLAYAGGDKDMPVTVIGTEPIFADVARVRMVNGRFLTATDMLRRSAHCVITESLALTLFGARSPLNQTVRLTGQPFIVVGVLARLPQKLGGGPSDIGNYVIMPFTTERMRYGKLSVTFSQGSRSMESVEISQIIMQMADEQGVIDGATVARSLLQRRHAKVDYQITVPLEEIEQKKRQMEIWSYVLLAIALVSLVVGGIGIMNIMLAGVTERTREIGIRRALGAKRRDIVTQFIVESVALTTVGGLLGIAIGMAVPWVVEATLKFKTIVNLETLLVPFVMAVAVGLVSGLYPALRAARLDPIEALRHE